MAIECNDKTSEAEVTQFLQSVGAAEVSTQYRETGWWMGRYDRETVVFDKQVEASM